MPGACGANLISAAERLLSRTFALGGPYCLRRLKHRDGKFALNTAPDCVLNSRYKRKLARCGWGADNKTRFRI